MTLHQTQASAGTSDLGFDPDALREKYRQEREKRLRPDGNDQYREVVGGFTRFVDDHMRARALDSRLGSRAVGQPNSLRS